MIDKRETSAALAPGAAAAGGWAAEMLSPSGKLVREILRTRDTAFDRDRMGAPADLIVLWQEAAPTDCVDSAEVGRVGPLPYFRSGGHSSQGFVLSRGPGIAAGSTAAEIAAQDLTATYRDLLHEPVRA